MLMRPEAKAKNKSKIVCKKITCNTRSEAVAKIASEQII